MHGVWFPQIPTMHKRWQTLRETFWSNRNVSLRVELGLVSATGLRNLKSGSLTLPMVATVQRVLFGK